MNGASAALRSPPRNLDAEQALLGAILVNNEALARVSSFLVPDHFYDPLHKQIYATISKMIASGKQATPITLKTFFETAEPIDAGLTVPQYLGRLAANAATIINARDYGRTIHDLATRRGLILIAEDVGNAAYDSPVDFDPREQIGEASQRLAALGESTSEPDAAALEFARDVDVNVASIDVVKHLLPAGAVAFLYGPSTAGKTFLTLDASFRVALGKEFLSRRTRRGAVLYVALEGSAGFGKRIKAAEGLHGDPGNYFARLKSLVTLGRSPKAEADVARIIANARLLAKQAGSHVALIVVDTLARALAGDNENEAAAISAVVSQANRIASETGAAVLIVHHPGKDQERGMRGSYALFADGDVVIRVEREEGTDLRTVVLEKAKDGEEGPVGAFTLDRVVLDQDADGDDITSCIVRYVEALRERRAKQPPAHTAAGKALNELDHILIEGGGTPAHGHRRIPDGVMLIRREDWRAACLAKGLSSGDPDSERRAFQRAVDQLLALSCVGTYGDDVWRIGSDKTALSSVGGSSIKNGHARTADAAATESGQRQ
jgi:hypothetical protein